MPASQEWTRRAAYAIVARLGFNGARVLVRELREIPGANASVRQTMARLDAAIEAIERKVEETKGAKR